jgi:TPR repeat protein
MIRSALLVIAMLALNACAGIDSLDQPPKMINADVWASEHFRKAHPDLVHRLKGQAHFEDGEFVQALAEFTEAASFGDKLSQAMLAEIHWEGLGVGVDRSLAYAWMDLAAERGFVAFVAKRERYWQALDAAERMRALQLGKTLYATHGDEVALQRMQGKLKRGLFGSLAAKPGMGGGRGSVILPGNGSSVSVTAGVPGAAAFVAGGVQMEFGAYYAREFWRLDQYVSWHEQHLDLARRGMVEVGPLQPVDEKL